MKYQHIVEQTDSFFSTALQRHGPTARGVDWKSRDAQELRFPQLLSVCDLTLPFTITDFGCGYGALATYLADHGHICRYQGYDICSSMVRTAQQLFADRNHCQFTNDEGALRATDYAVSSGIFNLKFDTSEDEWRDYVCHTLERMARLGRRGFAFNMLTRYADADHMRSHLYYADPCYYFHYCKSHFSRLVSLKHDYYPFEFTIIVRM